MVAQIDDTRVRGYFVDGDRLIPIRDLRDVPANAPDPNALSMWTVCKSPKDFPGQWTVRRWEVVATEVRGTSEMFVADTLDEIRALLPPGLNNLGRQEHDDPVIYETWV